MIETQNKTNGFLVVRKPQENFDEQNRGMYSDKLPRIGDIYYSGIDRMPWFDIMSDYYLKRLPKELDAIVKTITTNNDMIGIDLSKNLDNTSDVLQYANKDASRNEIISIYSPEFTEVKGEFIIDPTIDLEFLGFDFISLGYGSAIYEGIFQNPDFFGIWTKKINSQGLFDTVEYLSDYYDFCRDAVSKEYMDIVELFKLVPVQVSKVLNSNIAKHSK